MKKSKITKVTPNGSFESKFGKLYKFEVHFENGDYGDANCKTQNQTTWVVGQEVAYEITPNANPNFNPLIKKVQDEVQPKSDNIQRMIVMQSSYKTACDYLVGTKSLYNVNSLDELAKHIFEKCINA